MLQLTPVPLARPLADKIRRWLGADGSQEFARYLRSLSAEHAAKAANILCEKNTASSYEEEATLAADEATFYRRIAELLGECRDPDNQFVMVEITPVPVTNTSNEE